MVFTSQPILVKQLNKQGQLTRDSQKEHIRGLFIPADLQMVVLDFWCHQIRFCHISHQKPSMTIIKLLEIRSEKATEGHQDITHQLRNATNPDMNPSEKNSLIFV